MFALVPGMSLRRAPPRSWCRIVRILSPRPESRNSVSGAGTPERNWIFSVFTRLKARLYLPIILFSESIHLLLLVLSGERKEGGLHELLMLLQDHWAGLAKVPKIACCRLVGRAFG